MNERLIDGFRFVQWPKGILRLIIESDRLADCVNFCNKKRIKRLVIMPSQGYHLRDLEFLRDCGSVEDVSMQCRFHDMGGLYSLRRLTELSVICPNDIDFCAFPSLSNLSTDWTPQNNDALFSSKTLVRLWLRGYKPKNRKLTSIGGLSSLRELSVVVSSITSATGVEALPDLAKLAFGHCHQLKNIRTLGGLWDTLEELELNNCKKIAGLSSIKALKKLRKLILGDCGSIRSLGFISQMPHLEFLSFVKTRVADGDMTPCFRLKYAGFLRNRNYSHTPEQVNEIILKRHG